jgi:hypothetical protein
LDRTWTRWRMRGASRGVHGCPRPEGAEDVPWAHRVADEVEGPDSEWFRNQGWKGPEDAARSFRETKAELTRVQQEYARTLTRFAQARRPRTTGTSSSRRSSRGN